MGAAQDAVDLDCQQLTTGWRRAPQQGLPPWRQASFWHQHTHLAIKRSVRKGVMEWSVAPCACSHPMLSCSRSISKTLLQHAGPQGSNLTGWTDMATTAAIPERPAGPAVLPSPAHAGGLPKVPCSGAEASPPRSGRGRADARAASQEHLPPEQRPLAACPHEHKPFADGAAGHMHWIWSVPSV